SRRRHTRSKRDWSSDVCSSDLVTVIPKPSKRATIPEDFGIEPKYEGIPYDLVVDGKVMYKNLEKVGKNYIWLKKQTEKFGIKPEDRKSVVKGKRVKRGGGRSKK